jgi:hypothetical protein
MPRFEVVLPPAPPDQPFEVKLRVESETWLGALKAGLERICGPELAAQVVCELRADGAMEVQDPRGGRSFRVVELGAAEPSRKPPRAAPAPPRAERSPEERAREDALADLFLRAPKVLATSARPEDALGALLDLAREKVACDTATAWRADATTGVLARAAARGAAAASGPATLPFGHGIPGFCAQEGVCLAVVDAASDPRWVLSGAPASAAPRSVLCAPISRGNRVYGVLELADAKGAGFGDGDLAALAYLAHQAALWLDARERAS